jgi:hypothetical protein
MGRVVNPAAEKEISQKDVMIRIANHGDVELQDVSVRFPSQTEEYGNILPGQATEYRKIGKAYRYARVRAIANGKELLLQPTDYVGETLLQGGNYTYVLKNKPDAVDKYDRLWLEFVEENDKK